MGQLSSGSIGLRPNLDYDKYPMIGALVKFRYREYIGIILDSIDIEYGPDLTRYRVYYDNGKMFGTYLEDLHIIQAFTGSMKNGK